MTTTTCGACGKAEVIVGQDCPTCGLYAAPVKGSAPVKTLTGKAALPAIEKAEKIIAATEAGITRAATRKAAEKAALA